MRSTRPCPTRTFRRSSTPLNAFTQRELDRVGHHLVPGKTSSERPRIRGDAMGNARHGRGPGLPHLSRGATPTAGTGAQNGADDDRRPPRSDPRGEPLSLSRADREQPRRRDARPVPGFATHPRTDPGPIKTGTIDRAAEWLDLMLAMSEVYRAEAPQVLGIGVAHRTRHHRGGDRAEADRAPGVAVFVVPPPGASRQV